MQLSTSTPAFGFSGPLYAQVAAYLRGQISAAVWTPAAPLPNEAALAKDIGVSIGTVRKALEMLEDERLINRRQGRGTFVIDAALDAAAGRYATLTLDGRRLRGEVTAYTATIQSPLIEAASMLGLPAGVRSIVIDMEWRAGACVRCQERIIVSETRFAGLDAKPPPATPTLFHIYRLDHNVVVHRISERISAVIADEKLAQALDVAVGKPILQIVRIARTRTGEAIEWSQRSISLGGATYDATLG